MATARHFVLVNNLVRDRAADYLLHQAPDNWEVLVHEPRMNDGQRGRFHAMCTDLERSGLEWAGKRRTRAEWKVLLVSGHAVATKEGAEVIKGIEGELVNVRESTSTMGRSRGASLIDYAAAFCAMHGVRLSAPDND